MFQALRTATAALLLSAALCAPAFAEAGEVVLGNGDVLKGDVVPTPTGYVVRHATLGRLELAADAVREVRWDASRVTAEGATSDALLLGREERAGALALLTGSCDPVSACGPTWKVDLAGAFSVSQGNSESTSFVLGGTAIRTADPWTLTLAAGFLYQTDADGETSAERWNARVRVDRDFGGRTYAFGQVIFDRDEPADIEYRVTGVGGVGRFLIRRDNEELKAEVGGGAVHEKRVGLDATTDPTGYAGAHYWRCWPNKRRFAADFEFIPNLNDFDLSVARLILAYELPVSGKLSFVAGLRFDYVLEPADPTIESLDTLFTLGFKLSL